MATSRDDAWDTARQTFADQFAQDANNIFYRRSQVGEGYRVSAQERDAFIAEYDRALRTAKWILYAGLFGVTGIVIAISMLRAGDFSTAGLLAGIAVVMGVNFAYLFWAWRAPVRQLQGRMPIASALSTEQAQRLKFGKIKYPKLALVAVAGLGLPFLGAARTSGLAPLFAGWNWLWLAGGAAMILLAAVQAFRKWRFEQEDSMRTGFAPPPTPSLPAVTDDPGDVFVERTNGKLVRYFMFAAILGLLGILIFTPVGKSFVKSPNFILIIMIACGGYALFTVVQGFAKGQIEPFLRGFTRTYERDTEPKRFWASMAWNSFFGGLCLFLTFVTAMPATDDPVSHRCYDYGRYPRQEAFTACSELLKSNPKDGEAYLNRGLTYLDTMKLDLAIADFTRAHELNPKSPWPLADRGIAYAWKEDRERAEADFKIVRAMDPANLVVAHGEAMLDMEAGDLEGAVRKLNAELARYPNDSFSLRMRSDAYRQMGDFEKANADRDKAMKLYKARMATARRMP